MEEFLALKNSERIVNKAKYCKLSTDFCLIVQNADKSFGPQEPTIKCKNRIII